jgi:hypothetical protein
MLWNSSCKFAENGLSNLRNMNKFTKINYTYALLAIVNWYTEYIIPSYMMGCSIQGRGGYEPLTTTLSGDETRRGVKYILVQGASWVLAPPQIDCSLILNERDLIVFTML